MEDQKCIYGGTLFYGGSQRGRRYIQSVDLIHNNGQEANIFEGQIMSKDKYASIFWRQMEAILFIIIIFQICFCNTRGLKIGEYHSDIPQF